MSFTDPSRNSHLEHRDFLNKVYSRSGEGLQFAPCNAREWIVVDLQANLCCGIIKRGEHGKFVFFFHEQYPHPQFLTAPKMKMIADFLENPYSEELKNAAIKEPQ